MANPNIEDIFRLSPMQEIMLLHALAEPQSQVLATQFSYELRGSLNIAALRRAWTALVERHASLRTSFAWKGVPHALQIVRRSVELPFQEFDLRGMDDVERQRRLDKIRKDESKSPFDLTRAPLIRVTVVRLEEDLHLAIGKSHHLVLDRMCINQVFTDLASLYRKQVAAQPVALSPVGSFRDYVAWIRAQDPSDAEQYWRTQLAGLRSRSLLTDSYRTRRPQESKTTSLHQALSQHESERLITFARHNGLTVGSVLLGATALWMANATGKLDLLFGLTVSGRPFNLRNVEHIVGSFINNVPIRVKVDSGLETIDWIRGLQSSQAARNPYEYVSPADIREWCQLRGPEPLFDVLVLINPTRPETGTWPGLKMSPISAALETAYPVTLVMTEEDDIIALKLIYQHGSFCSREATIALKQLAVIILAILDRPHAALADVASLPTLPHQEVDSELAPIESPRPGGSVEEMLTSVWRRILDLEHIRLDDNLLTLGATSLQIAQAFNEMSKCLHRSLPLSMIFEASTIRGLMANANLPVLPSPSLVAIQPHGCRPQLFTVPGIGGNVVGLAGLGDALGTDQPFYGLQSKGLDGQADPELRIEDIAAGFVAEMMPIVRRPFALLGLCWGATVTYEIAQQLAAQGSAPDLVLLMEPPIVDDPAERAATIPGRASFVKRRIELSIKEFWQADNRERVRLLRHKAGRLVGLLARRDGFMEQQRDFYQFKVSESNLGALMRYQYLPYEGPVALLFTSDCIVSSNSPRCRFWQNLIEPDPTIRVTPGNNTGDTLTPQHVHALAQVIEQELNGLTM